MRIYTAGRMDGRTRVGSILARTVKPSLVVTVFVAMSTGPRRAGVGAGFVGAGGGALDVLPVRGDPESGWDGWAIYYACLHVREGNYVSI